MINSISTVPEVHTILTESTHNIGRYKEYDKQYIICTLGTHHTAEGTHNIILIDTKTMTDSISTVPEVHTIQTENTHNIDIYKDYDRQ